MSGADWAAILGPGGLIAVFIVADRVVRNWRAGKQASMEATNDQWQEIVQERDAMVQAQRRQLGHAWDSVDYWRLRAGQAEFLLRLHNIHLPAAAVVEPPRLG